jgi:hypothetical protein
MRVGLVFKQKLILSSLSILIMFFLVLLAAQAQLDDPTRPPGHRLVLPGGKTAATGIHFSLSSVRISSTRRSAIVNNRSVEAGDVVNGAKVVAIYPAAVKLKKQGKIFTVRLISHRVKKTRIR